MTKKELVSAVSKQTNQTPWSVNRTLDALTSTILDTLRSGDKVKIRGFATFHPLSDKSSVGYKYSTKLNATIS